MGKFESEESAFNIGFDYLKVTLYSFVMCNQCASMKNIDGWYDWLRVAYRQASCKTNETEDELIEKDFQEINKMLNDKVKRIREKNTILYKLDKLEIKLRKILQKKGMLLPSKDDPKYAILQR